MSTLGFQYSHALKADKYADLSMDLETKGYRTDLFPIKVGASGVVGSSTYTFLAKIGLSSRERTKALFFFIIIIIIIVIINNINVWGMLSRLDWLTTMESLSKSDLENAFRSA